jgi:2-polyprenyl-3-methyl-5-hydroxy-6-metoxy-1,4-benzoquinol methylase
MTQQFTSANTSINKNKLPAIANKIDFAQYQNKSILDYGCGKYDNFLNHLTLCGLISKGYDKYNRDSEYNQNSLSQKYDIITCNNVLNVISENTIVTEILMQIKSLLNENGIAYFTVYEGNKSGIGAISKKDCYQRNETTKFYITILQSIFSNVIIKNNVLICNL